MWHSTSHTLLTVPSWVVTWPMRDWCADTDRSLRKGSWFLTLEKVRIRKPRNPRAWITTKVRETPMTSMEYLLSRELCRHWQYKDGEGVPIPRRETKLKKWKVKCSTDTCVYQVPWEFRVRKRKFLWVGRNSGKRFVEKWNLSWAFPLLVR